MKQLSIKPGGSIVVDGFDGDVILTFDRLNSLSAELTVNAPEDISVKHGEKAKSEPDADMEYRMISPPYCGSPPQTGTAVPSMRWATFWYASLCFNATIAGSSGLNRARMTRT